MPYNNEWANTVNGGARIVERRRKACSKSHVVSSPVEGDTSEERNEERGLNAFDSVARRR